MEDKTSKPGGTSPQETAPPPPAPKRRKYRKQIYGGVVALVVLVIVIFYYFRFIAPYESTDDAFVDGYITYISPRVAGPVVKLLIRDNEEVKAGDELVDI